MPANAKPWPIDYQNFGLIDDLLSHVFIDCYILHLKTVKMEDKRYRLNRQQVQRILDKHVAAHLKPKMEENETKRKIDGYEMKKCLMELLQVGQDFEDWFMKFTGKCNFERLLVAPAALCFLKGQEHFAFTLLSHAQTYFRSARGYFRSNCRHVQENIHFSLGHRISDCRFTSP